MSPNNGIFYARTCIVMPCTCVRYAHVGPAGRGERNKVTAFSFLVVICEVQCEELKSVA